MSTFSTAAVDLDEAFGVTAKLEKVETDTATDPETDPNELDKGFIVKTYKFISENIQVITLLMALVIILVLIWIFVIRDNGKKSDVPQKSPPASPQITLKEQEKIKRKKDRRQAEETHNTAQLLEEIKRKGALDREEKLINEEKLRKIMELEREKQEDAKNAKNRPKPSAPQPESGSDMYTIVETPLVIDQDEITRQVQDICNDIDETSEEPVIVELGDAESLMGVQKTTTAKPTNMDFIL